MKCKETGRAVKLRWGKYARPVSAGRGRASAGGAGGFRGRRRKPVAALSPTGPARRRAGIGRTACADCRHYAAGSAVVTARMYRHAGSREHFAAWLDYVDTYLVVWVRGYDKGANIAPAGVGVPEKD